MMTEPTSPAAKYSLTARMDLGAAGWVELRIDGATFTEYMEWFTHVDAFFTRVDESHGPGQAS